MKIFRLAFLLLAVPVFGQIPQLYVAGGLNINGGGYASFGATTVGGVFYDTRYFLFDPEAGYATGGKSNDADNTSSEGHTRSLKGDFLVKVHGWYVGPGYSWSKLYTPAYDKSATHPRITVARDFPAYVNRVLITYMPAGSDKANGTQTINAQFYWFFGKHLFYRMDFGPYWAHDTVIPVSQGGSPSSVAYEKSHHVVSAAGQFALGWRF
jgi:hypothetical protein